MWNNSKTGVTVFGSSCANTPSIVHAVGASYTYTRYPLAYLVQIETSSREG